MTEYLPRLHCLITGCNRTSKRDHNDGDEWICAKHWRVIPKKRRRLYSLIKRRYKAGKINWHRYWRAWEKIKDIAHQNAWSV